MDQSQTDCLGDEQFQTSVKRKRRVIEFGNRGLATAFALGLFWTGTSHAQPYPDKPIRVVVPFTAGSPNDVVARVLAPPLSARLGQPVVVENRPGGSTVIGARSVLAADRDGYTLLQSSSPTVFLGSLVNENVNYDPMKDFVPIATVGSTALVMVMTPDVPVRTMADVVAYAKANPGALTIGYGRGTLPNLSSELLKVVTGANITSIPYRGGAQVVADMLGGRIHINLGSPATLLPLIRDGRLRAIAVTSEKRHPDLAEVPTMTESGFPGVIGTNHWAVLGPAGIPDAVVTKLNSEINQIMKTEEFQSSMRKIGAEPRPGTPKDFADLLAHEYKVWAPIVKATGFKLE
jgi:tripartite-type tricarboxylate transporter receptor subunit TctC